MTEEERAEYYERVGDDPQVWGELDDAYHVPTQARKKGGLSTTVTVRFAPEDAARLRQLAERMNLSYSDVVREAVRQVLEPKFVIDLSAQNIAIHPPYSDSHARGRAVWNPVAAAQSRTGASSRAG